MTVSDPHAPTQPALELVSVLSTEPYLKDPERARVTFLLSRAPDDYEVESAAQVSDLELTFWDQFAYDVEIGHLRETVIELDAALNSIAVRAANIRSACNATRKAMQDELAEIRFNR